MRRHGWKPDLPDIRDFAYAAVHKPAALVTLPPRVSLRPKMGPVYDQGQLGSCTANALCAALQFLHPGYFGSRLALYYQERVLEHDVGQDNGAQIRDGVKVLNKTGVGPESDWPYDPAKFAVKPPTKETLEGWAHTVKSYSRLTTGVDFRTCLASGFPFVIGFTVYESFESAAVARNGIVSMPKHGEKSVGGHAVCVIGYDTVRGAYEVRNSWGIGWGDAGNFWIPFAYFENSNLADDAWTLRS